MYKEDSRFEPPEKEAKIWRYMDFVKFLWMLNHQCLYFCRVDKFKDEDPFEGSWQPSEFLKNIPKERAVNLVEQANSCGPPITINCWHLNDCESAAMWKLYGGVNKGIAIQSTFGRLVKAFEIFPDDIYISKVRYIDYKIDKFKGEDVEIFEPVITKRKSFEHEKELRAIIWDTSKITVRSENGSVCANINLKELIDKIYIAPFAPTWHKNIIQVIIKKFGLEISVEQSEINKKPLY